MSLYSSGKKYVRFFYKSFYRLEYSGGENVDRIPQDQGILLCSNHVSNLDPPAVGVASPRELSFMAKSELFKVPLLKKLITTLNAFPVNRGAGDRQAIKTAIRILNDGGTLIMFPEGTRSKDGALMKPHPGAGFLAMKTNAAIIPAAIIGRFKLFRKTKIILGKPIDFSVYKEQKIKPQEASEIIMKEIEALINENK